MSKRYRIITAALVPALALGAVGLGTAATAAPAAVAANAVASSGPWSEPAKFSGEQDVAEVIDLRTTSEGDVVALWYRTVPVTRQLELSVTVRPAASTEWGVTTVLDVLPEGRESVSLTTAPDGSATATWVNAGESDSVLRTATLGKGATSWSAPADIATGANIGEVAFATTLAGRGVAVWRVSEGRDSLLYVSERAGSGGVWSAPAVLVAADAFWPQAVIAPDGAVTVAWARSVAEGTTVRTVTKAAGATEWSAPADVSAPSEGGTPYLSLGPDGTKAVAWVRHRPDDEGLLDIVSTVMPAGDDDWTPLHVAPAGDSAQLTDTLVGPDGDVTLVWLDYQDTFGVRTATRSASTGDWSATRTLSSEYVPEQFDADIGPDGTVRAGWVQDEGDGRVFYTAARTGGEWGPAVKLSRTPSDYAEGAVAAGPDGNATAVWAQDDQLWTSGTALDAPAPAARRDYAGADGFPDLYARTTAGALIVYKGNASHAVSAKVDGGTWPTTSTLIPFGDLDGDGCNDTLVRDGAGALHRYSPACGDVVTPAAPSTQVGTGWQGYDGFSYSGDLDGDGLPDLVARQISTGDLYLYSGTTAGKLTRTGKIGTGWKSLTVVGAGDLNKDGVGDLLARNTTGELYRYDGNGTGGVRSGVKIGTGWNTMADIVGIGDLTGDGTDDIVARTTTGYLYRYDGNGTGGVRSGVRIGTGWKSFTGVS
ncbi:FG-GAP-like repeat-containing protein [Streptomyces sp. bgisy091]|uniref:FG-GAP-like repeat-containing protein n=1 Tax=Streptomyces sp. bgisy091 TaxID=3413778 RepID=UPI003D706866